MSKAGLQDAALLTSPTEDSRFRGAFVRCALPRGIVRQATPESSADTNTYSMQSFPEWLEHRQEKVPDTMRLAMQIAQSGPAGESLDRLRKVTQTSPDALDDLLKALVAAGQVRMLKAGGQLVYRAAG